MKKQRGFLLNPYRFGGGGPPPATATFDPANKGTNCTLSGGDLTADFSGVGSVASTEALIVNAKCEFTINASAANTVLGVIEAGANMNQYVGQNTAGYGYYGGGNVAHGGSFTGGQPGYTIGDIIGVEYNLAGDYIQFYKNGTPVGATIDVSGLGSIFFAAGGGGAANVTANFGGSAWAYF